MLGWEHGTGRCANMMGKIHVKLPNGIEFKIGAGREGQERVCRRAFHSRCACVSLQALASRTRSARRLPKREPL